MKIKTKILLILFSLIVLWVIIIQFFTYKYPEKEEINKRINYLQRIINQPLEESSEVMLLRSENPEFMFFTYSYSVYALTNIAINDFAYKNIANDLIKKSIMQSLNYEIYSQYGINENIMESDTLPDYSVLYLGHLNLMLGCYRLISNDTTFNELNRKISESLYKRYNIVEFLNLESYPSSIWIPDNTVAIASLKLYSKNEENNYDNICNKWVEYAKSNYIEKETNVLYSTIDPVSGKPVEEPRGSMLGWSIMFIYQFDSEFAINLYNNYKKNFSNEFLIFRLFKERYNNHKTSIGDIDSGPIFLGYSIPANEFALGCAILSGDFKTARKLERFINFGAKKIKKNNEIKYDIRFIDMNISPMAEALVLNSLTITKWIN